MFAPQGTIEAERVILKIDIEGYERVQNLALSVFVVILVDFEKIWEYKTSLSRYECKALPEEILMGSSGKKIPFIFLEWGQLVSG